MLRSSVIALALLASPVASFAGGDAPMPAQTLVASAAEALNASEGEQIADAILERLDTQAIARFTLGRHGKALDAAAVERFSNAFEAYLRRQIVANADQFSGVEVNVVKTVARNARDAIVTTRVERADTPLTLRWRVIERGGQWSVVDLEFAGVWLAIEQRAQVSAILDRPGAGIEDVIAQFG